jgi:hypothetical protein
MRLLKCALVVSLLTLVPARADAWFGFLDYLSGPGPFYGQLYDVRLVCFGGKEQFHVADDAEKALINAIAVGANVVVTKDPKMDPWYLFQQAVKGANDKFAVVPESQMTNLQNAIVRFKAEVQQRATSPQRLADPDDPAIVAFQKAIQESTAVIDAFYHANVVGLSPGVLLSLCPERSTRIVSLDLDTGFWQANSRTDFANDHSIRLITVMAGVSYRHFHDLKHANRDFIDIGGAIGKYWFTSRGFDEFSGLVFQFPRIDIHGPTSWANDPSCAKKFAALLTFRFSWMVFPGGFDANAFAGTGDHAKPIGTEWTPSLAIFFNITPFLHHHNVFGTPKSSS